MFNNNVSFIEAVVKYGGTIHMERFSLQQYQKYFLSFAISRHILWPCITEQYQNGEERKSKVIDIPLEDRLFLPRRSELISRLTTGINVKYLATARQTVNAYIPSLSRRTACFSSSTLKKNPTRVEGKLQQT